MPTHFFNHFTRLRGSKMIKILIISMSPRSQSESDQHALHALYGYFCISVSILKKHCVTQTEASTTASLLGSHGCHHFCIK